ncbi:zinc finger MYM-type protein 1-like [Dorcoceras hygrometricum]|uniref:Zinc finger MYM-type protein 1-like n=1 Tax=Dorcoceras hygrometricum TaxID=472368 RepID=A0A2Z7AZ05_9LAMI|nr:zinc finger MYM-type protein 1-like [Dorcoceras hygrometricum]
MIALDFSGTTHQSASHNVAFNQVINQSVNQDQDDLGIRSWKPWGGPRLRRGWLDPLVEPKASIIGWSDGRVHVASCEPSCELVQPWFEPWIGPWLGLDLRNVLLELLPRVAGGGGPKGASCRSRVGGCGGD